MRLRRSVGSVFSVVVLTGVMAMSCGGDGDDDSPGPGGATISGNIATASTASLERSRSSLFAWIGENIIGLARNAYAQVVDTSVGGITVIARGQGREVSDLTGSNGEFVVVDAPTGDITVIFRRGACEASLPLGNVISTSSIILDDTDFSCPSGSDVGTVDPTTILESFQSVLRNEDDPEDSVTQCVRLGDSSTDRDVDFTTARLEDEDGDVTSYAAFQTNDLVQITGERIGSGDGFGFIADLVEIIDRDARDVCATQL